MIKSQLLTDTAIFLQNAKDFPPEFIPFALATICYAVIFLTYCRIYRRRARKC